jgi:hypothetical protein
MVRSKKKFSQFSSAMHETFCKMFLLLGMCIFFVCLNASRAESQIGDRLVLAVNGAPWSQRSIEVHILLREALRADQKGKVPKIDAKSWPLAIDAFIDDAVVQQEAQRLGSFQPSEAAMRRAKDEVLARRQADPDFAASLTRLGVDDASLERSLQNILRIEAFRRSKERQAAVSARGDDSGDENSMSWAQALRERAVARIFQGAREWVEIHPNGHSPVAPVVSP